MRGLKHIRERTNQSVTQFAKQYSCHRNTVNYWESDKGNIPDWVVEAISEQYHIQPEHITSELTTLSKFIIDLAFLGITNVVPPEGTSRSEENAIAWMNDVKVEFCRGINKLNKRIQKQNDEVLLDELKRQVQSNQNN